MSNQPHYPCKKQVYEAIMMLSLIFCSSFPGQEMKTPESQKNSRCTEYQSSWSVAGPARRSKSAAELPGTSPALQYHWLSRTLLKLNTHFHQLNKTFTVSILFLRQTRKSYFLYSGHGAVMKNAAEICVNTLEARLLFYALITKLLSQEFHATTGLEKGCRTLLYDGMATIPVQLGQILLPQQ